MTLTINNNGVDYMRYLSEAPQKVEKGSQPILFDFTLVGFDSAFVKPVRGNYVEFTTSNYGTTFTGYITNDPQPVFIGSKNGVAQYSYKFEATSDDYLLNRKQLGFWPPFINTTQGAVLKALIAKLSLGSIDTTNISNGQVLARCVVDPQQYFSDIVKAFCDASYYKFWCQSKKAYFTQQLAGTPLLVVDGSNKHFSPSALTVQPVNNPIVNDVTVLGNTEPQDYMTEYFMGDGAAAQFRLVNSVFGVDSTVLLDEDFGGSSIDSSKWTIYDLPADYLQVSQGYLNVLGGPNDNSYSVHLDSANLIGLEGNMRLTHGQYDFVQGSDGVICGLWTQAPNSSFIGCLYGIRCFISGSNTIIEPIINGAVDASQQITIDTTYRYVFRTISRTQSIYRVQNQYAAMSQSGDLFVYGGTGVADAATYNTFISIIDPQNGTIVEEVVWTHPSYAVDGLTVYANYIPVASNNLNVTVTGITLSYPMQVTLDINPATGVGSGTWVRKLVGANELDSSDGIAPVATIADSNNGTSTRSSYLGTPQYNVGNASLTFFKNTAMLTTTVPQPGDIVRLFYRSAGAAMARVQDVSSVATEAAAWGDDGVRSITINNASPLPRTAAECELAGQAAIEDKSWQHFTGTYSCYAGYGITSEPRGGGAISFSNLPSSIPDLNTELITSVTSSYASDGPAEVISHKIEFGPIDYSSEVLSAFTLQKDVFLPLDTAELPKSVEPTSVGLAFAADVTDVELVNWDTSNYYYTTQQNPPSGGGFEVRYSDSGWGAENGTNLLTRFTSGTTFSAPRNLKSQILYVRAYDGRNIIPYSEDLTKWTLSTGTTAANASQLDQDGNTSVITSVDFAVNGTCSELNVASQDDIANLEMVGYAWVKGVAGKKLTVTVGSSVSSDSTQYTLTGLWQKLQVAHTVGATGGTNLIGVTFTNSDTVAHTVQIRQCALEVQTTTPTVYAKTLATRYGALSRYAAGVHVAFALPPAAPTAIYDLHDPQNIALVVTLPNVLDNVWGVEIRASDNVTVVYHENVTSYSYNLTYTIDNSKTQARTFDYYVYTYNILTPTDYSPAYHAVASLPAPTVSGCSVDDKTKSLNWTMTETFPGQMITVNVVIATDSQYTNVVLNQDVHATTFALSDNDYYQERYFKVTPTDSIGSGGYVECSHVYVPASPVEFNANEVTNVAPPPSGTSSPTPPAGLPAPIKPIYVKQSIDDSLFNRTASARGLAPLE